MNEDSGPIGEASSNLHQSVKLLLMTITTTRCLLGHSSDIVLEKMEREGI